MFKLTSLRSLSLAVTFAFTGIGGLAATPSFAQSPTSNADNGYEYNAYVYGYISMVYSDAMENSTYNDWQNSTSQMNVAYSNWFWSDQTAIFADRGFQHCYDALNDDTNSLWDDARDDFDDAIDTCDILLMNLYSTSASSSRIQQAESVRYYLQLARDGASSAHRAASKTATITLPGNFRGR